MVASLKCVYSGVFKTLLMGLFVGSFAILKIIILAPSHTKHGPGFACIIVEVTA